MILWIYFNVFFTLHTAENQDDDLGRYTMRKWKMMENSTATTWDEKKIFIVDAIKLTQGKNIIIVISSFQK